MTSRKSITNAKIDWRSSAPRSLAFDDIYFSGEGPAEAAYVFLHGNGLPARFKDASCFTIGELGFGTGLNFLVAWDAWRRSKKPANARLHYFSVEAFPLAADDLKRAHGPWPALAKLSAQLRERFPPLQAGFHRIDFDDGVFLTLFFGDAAHALEAAELEADAWFLDGFAPDKNPDMWRPEIMAALAARSREDATFATFTVAGAVRRGLQAAGFDIDKRPGFGAKREMLAGRLTKPPQQQSKRKPWFDTRPRPLATGARVAIIGAGIAGASLFHELSRAGFHPIVIEAIAPASGASGNRAGLIMPRLDLGASPAAHFHVAAYLHAVRLLKTLNAREEDAIFNPCGVVFHATSDAERERQQKLQAMKALPDGWIEAHADGLRFPQAGVVDPPALTRALLGEAPVIYSRAARVGEDQGARFAELENGDRVFADAIVIANGMDALRFVEARNLPLNASAGQVDWFATADAPSEAHACGPYAAPAPPFGENRRGFVIGATYAPAQPGETPMPSAANTRANIAAVAETLPAFARPLEPAHSSPRASIRATTSDRLPIIGPLPDWGFYSAAYDGLRQGRKENYPQGETEPGLYVLTGLGSRGLVTAPLGAAMIAAELAGAPVPVARNVAEALHPARFFIRTLKRAKLQA